MKLPFINELIEARMFTDPDAIKNKSANQIAEIVFLMFIMIEVIRQYKPNYTATYATDTLRYNTYENMHYAGTDLGNLLAVLNNQDTFKAYIKTESGVAIPLFQINRYLRDVSSKSKNSHSDDVSFFWRLEDFLKLYSNSLLRQLRRDVGNWKDLTRSNKEQIYLILRREFDKRCSSADMYLWYKSSFRLNEDNIVNESKISTAPDTYGDLPPQGEILASYTDEDGYTVSIRGGAPAGKEIALGQRRYGQYIITSPKGKSIVGGYWMAWPEEDWWMTGLVWDQMSWQKKAAMEVKQQATAYKPLKDQFKSRTKDNTFVDRLGEPAPVLEDNNILTELADSPYPFVVNKKLGDLNTIMYDFKTSEGRLYVVSVERMKHNNERALKVDFGLYTGEGEPKDTEKDFTTEIEGIGDAIKVFSTVKAIIDVELARKYIVPPPVGSMGRVPPRPVMYINIQGKAADPSRIKLYDRFARNAGKYFPGFRLFHKEEVPGWKIGEILQSWWLKRDESTLYDEPKPNNLSKTEEGAILNEPVTSAATERLDIEEKGDWNQRVFIDGYLQEKVKTWLDRPGEKVLRAEATVDLNPKAKMAYVNGISASITGRGFGSELLKYIIRQSKEHGYNLIRAYTEWTNINSKDMFRKAGFKEIKLQSGGSHWELEI